MEIKVNLNKNFVACMNRLVQNYGDEFTALNGFGNDNLNFSAFIDRFTADNKKLVDISINPTANMFNKDITSMLNGINEPHLKLLAYNKTYYETTKKYGRDAANKWLELEWNGTLYMHDAPSCTFLPYCWAVSLQSVAERGLYFIDDFPTGPAKHLTTFVEHVLETICWLSARQAGAVGIPDVMVYLYYFWYKDVQNGHFLKSPEYYAKQYMQTLIYHLNQPYMRITQPAFTNVSIMDREYLVGLFGARDFPDGTPVMDHIEGIREFQKWFMEVVHDIRKTQTFAYPVLTYSLLYQKGKFIDEEFARWCSDTNSYWQDSNFFVGSDITSLSSCCRLINDTSKLSAFINSIGGTALQVGSVKVSTINLRRIALMSGKDENKYLELLKDVINTDLIVLDIQRSIIKRNIEKGLLPNYSCGLMELEKQYSSIGITALFETLNDFGYIMTDEFGNKYYTREADRFAVKILDTINAAKDEWSKDKDYSLNVEAVPKQ